MSQSSLKVNACYVEYLDCKTRHLVLYGGSGSGKSIFAIQKVLLRTLSEKGHRFLCIRKVAKTLRGSVYQEILNLIDKLGLKSEFTVNKTEMQFTHLPTGNQIWLYGMDDSEKLKSVSNITGIWIEEATELSSGDYDQLDLRLRGETQHYKQIISTFNPIDERHWLKKRFFDRENESTTILKTTFKDNAFIDDEYRRVLEEKASISPNLYRIYYLGEWGREDVQRPYCINFNIAKHVSNRAQYIPGKQITFSLDFNVEPFVCECAHIWTDKTGAHYHNFDEIVIEKNGDVYEMCNLLLQIFGKQAIQQAVFTGDAMQRKREISVRNNIDAWRIIETTLNLGRAQIQVPRANPSVKENRHLINAIHRYHPDFIINPECTNLIFDCQYAECDEDGDLLKKDRNKVAQRLDALDCHRYMCNTFLRDFYERYKIK